ncbi:Uma2 family endonuclease [Rhodoplanes sp. TEM]|uniref:Uma2 family endonuclease n=1 Tax=Rhodoplanes tepidamans TaxID=200616 RepID=A0ABT5JC33_RHOTP|nr:MULTISPECIES: Uma2 family endonuclease [Rhodoplanes]MDC7787181.1 Uma2 family endonuclease [Rhodoplanes tepidamans]MDC7984255.1 Uma2 family endonuclease [Rhodoplanes sp. TEM]MDQ0356052.1 Uma2 family endonuclease [Rhodoplanes tepidamans]
MGVPRISAAPQTIEEFYDFTDRQPDEEKWELIEGEFVLQASPGFQHQLIVMNLSVALKNRQREHDASWEVLPGLGVRISTTSRPEPDVLILPKLPPPLDPTLRDRDDVLVVFEVLSPSTAERDLRWKREAYTSLASLTHYVVIAQNAWDVVVFARDTDFAELRLSGRDDALAFPALGVTLPLSEIYRDTGL